MLYSRVIFPNDLKYSNNDGIYCYFLKVHILSALWSQRAGTVVCVRGQERVRSPGCCKNILNKDHKKNHLLTIFLSSLGRRKQSGFSRFFGLQCALGEDKMFQMAVWVLERSRNAALYGQRKQGVNPFKTTGECHLIASSGK